MYFITPRAEKLATALEAWTWLDLAGKRPILVTAFADVFFEADDGLWFLETLEGKLERVCDTQVELDRLLASDEGRIGFCFRGLSSVLFERAPC